MQKYLNEVTKKYLSISSVCTSEEHDYLQQKMYVTHYKVHKLDIKDHRVLVKTDFSFSQKPLKEVVKIWGYIFKNTDILGVGSLAIDIFKSIQGKKSIAMLQFWPEIKTWIPKVENWVHGAMICSLIKDILSE